MIVFAEFKRILILTPIVILFMGGGRALADRVYLKSGDLMECVVVNETPASVTVQMEGGYVEFKRVEIVNVERASDEDNRGLVMRWKLARKAKMEITTPKMATCGQFFSVSSGGGGKSEPAFSANWFVSFYERVHAQFLAFPPTAFVLNLGPVQAYRRKHPALYVMVFFSSILLAATPIVALVQNGFLSWWNAEKRKRSKKQISS